MSEVRCDYIYKLSKPNVITGSPCDKRCSKMYKTSIPPQALSAFCARCGDHMNHRVVSKEISENQYDSSRRGSDE